MKAEKYIEQKATIIYSGGINSVKVITEKDALTAINLARKEKIEEAFEWLENNADNFISDFQDLHMSKTFYEAFRKAMEK